MADSEKMYLFKKQIRKLEAYRGSGTELISVYIAAGSPLHDTTTKLREELGQASNIKSKSTKLNVSGALEKLLNYLKIYKKTPDEGIVVFAGNVSDNPAKIDIELFSVNPIQPLSIGAYRCDSKFFLEPLLRMLESTDSYGIVAIDGSDATLARVKGTYIEIDDKVHSLAHAKVRKGGQSARRYERLVEEQKENYYKKVGEAMDRAFLGKVKGVVIGGPGPIKDYFIEKKYYNYQLKILGTVDVGYSDEYGVREILSKCDSILEAQEAIKEKILIDRFINQVVHDGLATYGESQVRNAIISKQADKVLISEGVEHIVGTYSDSKGNEARKVFRDQVPDTIPNPSGDGELKLREKQSLLEELADLARANNIEVEIISTNTTEGAQFLNGFAGVGAFLRYKSR